MYDLMTVNEDANYLIQVRVKDNDKWLTLTEEYSASAAISVSVNFNLLTNMDARVLSKRSDTVISEMVVKK
jgi:hypothetical protein